MNVFSLGTFTEKEKMQTGALFVTYNHYLTDRFSLEGSFVYEKFSYDNYSGDKKIGTESSMYYTAIVGACYKYVNSGWFGMSAELEVGASSANYNWNSNDKSISQNFVHLGMQVTPLLFSFGRSFGLNLGIGFGYKGIERASVYYLF